MVRARATRLVEAPDSGPLRNQAPRSRVVRRWRERGAGEEGTDLVGSSDGAVEGEPANGADSEGAGGRDAVRAGRGGRAKQSGGDCRVTGEDLR